MAPFDPRGEGDRQNLPDVASRAASSTEALRGGTVDVSIMVMMQGLLQGLGALPAHGGTNVGRSFLQYSRVCREL